MSNVADPYQPHAQADSMPQKSGGKGCLWGCLIAVGVVIVGVVCTGVGGYFFLTSQMKKYTAEAPMDLPTVEYDEAKMAELKARVDGFRDAIKEKTVPDEDLVLTAEEINALISSDENLKGRVYVEIEDERLTGQVSIPLDNIPGMGGRFLNGSGTFDVTLDDGVLVVTAEQMEVNGEMLPEAFMSEIRKENLAKDVYKDRENAEFIRQFEEIAIQGDTIVMRLKRDQAADESAPADTDSGEEAASETAEPVAIE